MNITVTQDNSRIEQLGSNGAGIILKLYDLAVDPNNTVNLQGNIKSNYAYGYQVDYLNDKYNPDFIVSTNNRYMQFEDPNVLNMLLRLGVGDGFGITEANLNGLHINGSDSEGSGYITFRNNTNITSFVEFKYFTNFTGGSNAPFNGCTNLKWIGLPDDLYARGGDDFFYGLPPCNVVVSSLKHYLTHDYGGTKKSRIPSFGGWDVSVDLRCGLYINDKDHKVEDVVVTADIISPVINGFSYSTIKSITWESDQDIPAWFGKGCENLTSLVITGNVKNVGELAFDEATNLQILASSLLSLLSIGIRAFRQTKVSGELSLPNLTYIGPLAFEGCNITKINNLGTITNLPASVFGGCTNLTSITIPVSCKTCEVNFNNSKISLLIFPYGFETSNILLSRGTWGKYLQYVQFPETTTHISFSEFFRDAGSDHLWPIIVIQSTTPVDTGRDPNNTSGVDLGWGYYIRPSEAHYYVPDSAVNTYKESAQWVPIADSIKPISQLETDFPTYWNVYQANKDYGKS